MFMKEEVRSGLEQLLNNAVIHQAKMIQSAAFLVYENLNSIPSASMWKKIKSKIAKPFMLKEIYIGNWNQDICGAW